MACEYAKQTDQKWAGNMAQCYVFECHNPRAQGKLKSFKDEQGREYPAVRRPCDERFNLIPDADYLHVRSRFCNAKYCPFYEENKGDK